MSAAKIWKLEALTDIWTGDANGKPDRLITTGLLGSIRWWFEVVVRGLDGAACDPSHHKDNKNPGPCPQPGRKPHDAGHHCAVCELFGCTDWARKFRFDVLGADDVPQHEQIKEGDQFQLRFTPLRPIRHEEWAFLDLTIRLIACYGAIGGKTVYKPTEEPHRQPPQQHHHQDFGLVRLLPGERTTRLTSDNLQVYVSEQRWRDLRPGDFNWASLHTFWFVPGRFLARESATESSFNRGLGRKESKECRDCGQVHNPPQKCATTRKHPRRWSDADPSNSFEKWLAGGRANSKKLFSFKEPESARRTFGFVQAANRLDEMRARLEEKAWDDLGDNEFVRGSEILDRLLGKGESG